MRTIYLRRAPKTSHGMTGTWQFHTLNGIKQRCTNPETANYERYGGRGITYDPRWNEATAFFEDLKKLGPRPRGHTLDRIENSKGYFIENLRWAPAKKQQRNTRRNHLISHNGQTKCLAEWAEDAGMIYATLYRRIAAGWPMALALVPPATCEATALRLQQQHLPT